MHLKYKSPSVNLRNVFKALINHNLVACQNDWPLICGLGAELSAEIKRFGKSRV